MAKKAAWKASGRYFFAWIRCLTVSVALVSSVVSCNVAKGEPQAAPARVPRVAFVHSGSPQPYHQDFRQGLQDAGYVDGQNVIIEYLYAEGQADRLAAILESLVAQDVDVIVAADGVTIQAAKDATTRIPIVMGVSSDPVASGFVQSLARPGGNITGMSILGLGANAKRIEFLKEVVPTATRIGLLMNPQNMITARQLAESEEAGHLLGVEIVSLPVQRAEDLDIAFQTAVDQQLGALFMVGDPLFTMNRGRLGELLLRHKMPSIVNPEIIEAGGLLSYSPTVGPLLYRSASYVDHILKGTKPAELPVEQPTRFQFMVNMTTAEALDVKIPPSMLLNADRIIH